MKTQKIKIGLLETNNGQIEGLPANPRIIRDDRFKKLVKSIETDPEMLELRELIVIPVPGGHYVVIGGNMRLEALRKIGATEAPCKVLPADTPAQKLRAYTIKDNVSYGEMDFDNLANEWEVVELEDWGQILPFKLEKTKDEEPDEHPGKPDTRIVLVFEAGQCLRVRTALLSIAETTEEGVLMLLKAKNLIKG